MATNKSRKWAFRFALLVLLIACVVVPISVYAVDGGRVELLSRIVFYLNKRHYSPKPLDDTFSQIAFMDVINRFDPGKQFFTQGDIESLKKYQTQIDNELISGSDKFLTAVDAVYLKRVKFVMANYRAWAGKPFNLNLNDTIEADPKKMKFAANEAELKLRWQNQIKYQTITNYLTLTEVKSSEKKPLTLTKVNPSMEQEAHKKALTATQLLLERIAKHADDDHVSDYFDVMLSLQDPHSNYLPPDEKEDFDIGITGKLEGIGALLKEEDGLIKVVRIIPGSAAYRQKSLEADDVLLKVAQEGDQPVDLVNMRVRDAVKLIRGKSGTKVRLTVKKADGRIMTIAIVRDVVVIEETYARAAIFESKTTRQKLGYVYLPGFYRDFDDQSARNSTDDVARLVKQLSAKKVDGIILDLRNNGGGALQDAVGISGLFVPTGPIVQERGSDGKVDVLSDNDPSVEFKGPLIVLVNRFSASASEILAAALQDYNRAIVVGSPSTFGKGTVQTVLNLDHFFNWFNIRGGEPLGSAKLTLKKFYRVNGGSTQYKGVSSDIVLPDSFGYLEVGEKYLDHSLAWDTVTALEYDKYPSIDTKIATLGQKSQGRIEASPAFKLVGDNVARLKRRKEQSRQTLNLLTAYKEQQQVKQESKKLEKLGNTSASYTITILSDETPKKAELAKRNAEWQTQMNQDIYLDETLDILQDFVRGN